MAREDPQLKFRVPAQLRERLEDAAQASGRSVSAEIVQRLESSLAGYEPSPEKFEESLAELRKMNATQLRIEASTATTTLNAIMKCFDAVIEDQDARDRFAREIMKVPPYKSFIDRFVERLRADEPITPDEGFPALTSPNPRRRPPHSDD